MKRTILTLSMGLALFAANGQQKQGRVLYERTVQMRRDPDGMDQMIPPMRKDKLEVLFGNDQSLLRPVKDDAQDEMTAEGDGGGRHVFLMIDGNSDLTYVNFATDRIVEEREFGARNYIVADSIRKLNWKLTGETRTVLNYPCQQAIAQRVGKRMSIAMENGELKNTEVADTMTVSAWFTLAIPVPAGPEYQGQLPGLIMAVDINNGRVVYQAVELSPTVDLGDIKEPSKGKKVSPEQFVKEREKVMKEMQSNRGRKGAPIRIGG
ncbi:MAG TPA: GLPGLI family protein [Chitinophaga sp.]